MVDDQTRENIMRRGTNIAADDVLRYEEVAQITADLLPLFQKQAGLLSLLVKAMNKDGSIPRGPWRLQNHPSAVMKEVLELMMMGAEGSCGSMVTLAQGGKLFGMRDCLQIGRSVVETLVNITYILAIGDEGALRMKRHAMQKEWRDRYRTSTTGEFDMGYAAVSRPDRAKNPELDAAINEFTFPKGRENTAWTNESIENRLTVIGSKFGLPVQLRLKLGYFSLYRHASEIAHGTYYGNLYFLGGPPGARETPTEDVRAVALEHLVGLLHSLIGGLEATMMAASVTFLAPAFQLGAAKVVEEMMKLPGMVPFIHDDAGAVK